jgi:hypothetical protein
MHSSFMLFATVGSHGSVAFLPFRASRSQARVFSLPERNQYLGDHIRAHRLDLKLRQKQVAKQIGVDELTITTGNATQPYRRSASFRPLSASWVTTHSRLPTPSQDALSPRADGSACRSGRWPRSWASIHAPGLGSRAASTHREEFGCDWGSSSESITEYGAVRWEGGQFSSPTIPEPPPSWMLRRLSGRIRRSDISD